MIDRRWLERKNNLTMKDVDGHVDVRSFKGPQSDFSACIMPRGGLGEILYPYHPAQRPSLYSSFPNSWDWEHSQGSWIWVWVLSSARCNRSIPMANRSSKDGVASITQTVVEMYIEEVEGAEMCETQDTILHTLNFAQESLLLMCRAVQ